MVVTLLGALLLVGCAGPGAPAHPAKAVSSWMTGPGGGSAIGQVEADGRNVDLVLDRHDPSSAVRTACALLTNDALTAIGNLPTPDLTLTDDLNNAFTVASAAGKDCYNGASGDASLLRRSATERAKLVSLLAVAVDRVEAITGHAPSTSTTEAANAPVDPFGN